MYEDNNNIIIQSAYNAGSIYKCMLTIIVLTEPYLVTTTHQAETSSIQPLLRHSLPINNIEATSDRI